MKTIILSVLLTLAYIISFGQAHLGLSESEIKSLHPDNVWTRNSTKKGIKYIVSDFFYGTFAYYFDSESSLSDWVIQIPFNNIKLNGQVEEYNKKYVITSDTTWTAYLDGGTRLYISLLYDEDNKNSYFSYSDTK